MTNTADRSTQIRAKLDAYRKNADGYQDLQRLMIRYAIERFLHRLSKSSHKERFVLKGAMLLELYLTTRTRTTANVDFLAFGEFSAEAMKRVVRDICSIKLDDGIKFKQNSITVTANNGDRDNPGFKVAIASNLGEAPIPLSLDICFGEVVYPPSPLVSYPSLLDLPHPHIRVYPPETIVAEKFQTVVARGMGNNRLKDYYDLWALSVEREFYGVDLQKAIAGTFERRKTAIPGAVPVGLTETFYGSKRKKTDWQAFLKKHGLSKSTSLEVVSVSIANFAMPLCDALLAEDEFDKKWVNVRGWS